MIDVLYILGKSVNFHYELLASLRTLNKFVPDVNRVFITGECPNFIDHEKITYTPAQDISCPMTNHWWKVQKTIDETDIGENFVLMYDDIFFQRETELTTYPFYNKGLLGEAQKGGGKYQKILDNTKKWLKDRGMTYYDHELHVPCIYNKTRFKMLEGIFEELVKSDDTLAVRSVYGNLFHQNTPERTDVKIRKEQDTQDKQIMLQECISCEDYTFPVIVAPYIEQNTREKSPWEK